MKRLLKLLTAAVAVILLFTACQQFLEDPEDFLSYWASETFVKNHSIGSAHRPDGAGVQCVGSLAPVDITLTVHNPKGFSFVMPTSLAPAGIVEFKELSPQPEAGTDYDLIQTGSGTLKLTYKPSLLQKYEQGSRSLNPTITLKATDGRVFKQTYTFGIKSNTPLPKPKEIVLAKTKGSDPHYVLCLKFDSNEMTRKIGTTTVPVHKDIEKITINGSSYSLLYENNNLDFKKPEGGSFIEHEKVEKLDSSSPNVPSGAWVLYYKTNIKIGEGNPLTTYHITLRDKGGVTSDEAAARIEASGPTHTVTFSVVGGQGGSLTGTYNSASQTASGSTVETFHNVPSGSMVTFTANPDTVNGYEVEKWTLDGNEVYDYTSTEYTLSNITGNATVTVKFKKKIYTVTYLVEIVDGEAGGTIEAESYGQTTSGTVSVTHGGSVTFTGRPATGDWKVAEWKKDNIVVNGTNSTYTLSNITENKEVTVKFYQSTLKNPATWKDLARAVKSAPDNATLTIDGKIQATDVDADKSEIDIKKNLTIKGENSAILDAAGKRGIFDVYKILTLKDITLKNSKKPYNYSGGAGVYINSYGTLIMKGSSVITECLAENSGGGVYVGGGTFEMHDSSAITGCSADKEGGGVYVSGGTFKMQDSAIVTPSTGPDQYTAGKNDVYLESGKMITVDGTLTGTAPVARITVPNTAYNTSTQVLTGAITGGIPVENYKKFTVTPQDVVDGKMFWYITNAGKLKAEVEDLQTLKEAVNAAPDNTPFVIKLAGTISNLETVQIPNGKKITLKADNVSKPAILKCPDNGHWQALYTYFEVQSGASLTLEGLITLQGVDSGYRKIHHALSVNHNGNAEIKSGVTITGFKNSNVTINPGSSYEVKHSGKGPVFVDGTLTMSGGTIKENTVENDASEWSGGGGGVYVGATGNFIMKGGTITKNKASGYNTSNGGSGVYVKGQFEMEGGTIEENKEAYAGGGVLVVGTFDMKGGKITKNKSDRGKGVMVRGGTFNWQDGEITDNMGLGAAVETEQGGTFNDNGHTAS